MQDKFKTNILENALRGMSNGALIANNVAKRTMGPKGISVCLEQEFFPFSSSTDDGATVIAAMQFADPLEKRGLGYLKEACIRSDENANDGSTATCGILSTILLEGALSTEKEVDLKNGMDTLLPVIEDELESIKKLISVEEVEKVATIAGKSKEKGRILGEIYKEIGKDGVIHHEGVVGEPTSYTILRDSVRFKSGYFTSEMVYDEEAEKLGRTPKRALYENPVILISKRKIEKAKDITSIMEYVLENNRPLVIFANDMDGLVARELIATHRAKVAKITIINPQTIYKNSVFEDFAKCTGAKIIGDETGTSFTNKNILECLGTCAKISITAEETVLMGIQDITEHVENLKTKTDVESKMRLFWLTPNTAYLKIGGLSETDLSYHMKKYEDAIGSSMRALQTGVVVGGGITLYNIAIKLKTLNTPAGDILAKALITPFMQLCENSGIIPDFEKIGGELGYDFEKSTKDNPIIVNMLESGIMDSVEVIKREVMNSVGIASTAITTPFMIALPPKTPEMITAEVLAQKGIRPF